MLPDWNTKIRRAAALALFGALVVQTPATADIEGVPVHGLADFYYTSTGQQNTPSGNAGFVFMLTTQNGPNMKERGKAAGVNGWIVKSFKGSAVLETFTTLVA
jgi:hypothetical protein